MNSLEKRKTNCRAKEKLLNECQKELIKEKGKLMQQKQELEVRNRQLKEKEDQLTLLELKISSKEKLLKKRFQQVKKAGMKQTNSSYFKGKTIKSYIGLVNTNPDSEMLHDDGGDSPAGYNHSMKFGNQNLQHLNEHSEEGHNLQKRFAEEYDVNLQQDYDSQYQDEGMNPNEEANFEREGLKLSSRNLNHEFNKTANRNVSVRSNDNSLAK